MNEWMYGWPLYFPHQACRNRQEISCSGPTDHLQPIATPAKPTLYSCTPAPHSVLGGISKELLLPASHTSCVHALFPELPQSSRKDKDASLLWRG